MDESYTHLEDEHDDTPIKNFPTPCQKGHLEKSSNSARKKLFIACGFCLFFMIAEIVAGFLANSLALITDASHLLTDVFAYMISIFAISVANIRGNNKMSFGYHRAEILGALCSIFLIWGLTAVLIYLAIQRILSPIEVNGGIMLLTAIIGTVVNIFITYILKVHSHGIGSHDHTHEHTHDHDHEHSHHHDHQPPSKIFHKEAQLKDSSQLTTVECTTPLAHSPSGHDHSHTNVNLRAAYIHALGDLIQNIGVIVAGFIIWIKPSWSIADPICTLCFSVLVLYTTFSILIESLNVLMEGSPAGFNSLALQSQLSSIEGVIGIHDLHVWSLSIGKPSLACHIVIDEFTKPQDVLKKATSICQIKFGVLHTTIQIDQNIMMDACSTSAHLKCN